MSRVLVILGAGASYDVVDVDNPHPAHLLPDFRPPLTSQLFTKNVGFDGFLTQYKGVRSLVSTLRRMTDRGVSLEAALRILASSTREHRRSQLAEVPLYLMDVFWKATEYASEPVNYTHLADALLDTFDQVGFLTLNYDLLLEKALAAPYWGGSFDSIDSYARDRFLLVKLHGSVNWATPMPPGEYNPASKADYVALLNTHSVPRPDDLFKEVVIASDPDYFWSSGTPTYPLLSLPIEGKYQYACPDEHVERLKDFAASCNIVVAIGASGKDQDLFDILRPCLPDCQLLGDHNDAQDAYDRFSGALPQLSKGTSRCFDKGFSAFLGDDTFFDLTTH